MQNYGNEIGNWVLCRIFMKKRRNIENGYMMKRNIVMNTNVEVAQPRFIDFMRVHNSAPDPTTRFSTSSSCSSSSEVSSSEERCNDIYTDF